MRSVFKKIVLLLPFAVLGVGVLSAMEPMGFSTVRDEDIEDIERLVERNLKRIIEDLMNQAIMSTFERPSEKEIDREAVLLGITGSYQIRRSGESDEDVEAGIREDAEVGLRRKKAEQMCASERARIWETLKTLEPWKSRLEKVLRQGRKEKEALEQRKLQRALKEEKKEQEQREYQALRKRVHISKKRDCS